jgi:hypothetical protein
MYDKEQQEYMHWLARVKAFVDAKPCSRRARMRWLRWGGGFPAAAAA